MSDFGDLVDRCYELAKADPDYCGGFDKRNSWLSDEIFSLIRAWSIRECSVEDLQLIIEDIWFSAMVNYDYV